MTIITFLLLTTLSFSSFASDTDADSANQLIELNNKTFNEKQLLNNPDLCEFQNDLIAKASKKYKHNKLNCSRRKEDKTETNDEVLNTQLKNISNSMAVINVQHPESSEITQEDVANYAKEKMKKQGFIK